MRIFIGGATFTAGRGGIAQVARMSARSLLEAGYQLDMDAFLDDSSGWLSGHSIRGSSGSKVRFVFHAQRAAFSHTHFVYDSLGLARAQPRLPGLKRPYAVWINGEDAWNPIRKDYAALHGASMVFTNTRHTLHRCEEAHGKLDRHWLCPLATWEDTPPVKRASFDGVPTVLIVGRVELSEGKKGHAELLRCWPEVVAQVPRARLVIAGSGSGLEVLRAAVAGSSVASNIDVLGFVPEDQMDALYASAHVFAMPSRQEGFGIVYAEAMRFGLPIIASVHDAGQEVNSHGQTGFNVDLDDADDLTRCLITLLEDRRMANELGQNAFETWQSKFRFGQFAKRFIDGFERFAGS